MFWLWLQLDKRKAFAWGIQWGDQQWLHLIELLGRLPVLFWRLNENGFFWLNPWVFTYYWSFWNSFFRAGLLSCYKKSHLWSQQKKYKVTQLTKTQKYVEVLSVLNILVNIYLCSWKQRCLLTRTTILRLRFFAKMDHNWGFKLFSFWPKFDRRIKIFKYFRANNLDP